MEHITRRRLKFCTQIVISTSPQCFRKTQFTSLKLYFTFIAKVEAMLGTHRLYVTRNFRDHRQHIRAMRVLAAIHPGISVVSHYELVIFLL